jgi:hypothetical protein
MRGILSNYGFTPKKKPVLEASYHVASRITKEISCILSQRPGEII